MANAYMMPRKSKPGMQVHSTSPLVMNGHSSKHLLSKVQFPSAIKSLLDSEITREVSIQAILA